MLCLSGFELYSRWVPLSIFKELVDTAFFGAGILPVIMSTVQTEEKKSDSHLLV